ncbi:MAG: DUF1648 domain-containing protein [Micropruina sp.]
MAEGSGKPVVRVVLGALALPVLTLAATGLAVWSWQNDLPNPIATHWSASGDPDGFSSVGAMMAWLVGLGGSVIAAAIWGALAKSSAAVRSIVPLVAGAGAFLLVFLAATVAPQRGVADAATVALPGWAFLWGTLAGVVAGLITVLILPRWASPPPDGLTPARVAVLDAIERPVWTRVVTTTTPALVVAGLTTLLMLVLAVVTDASWMIPIGAFLLLAMVAMIRVRVTVNAAGLRVSGPLGWPRVMIRLDEIETVATAEVRALREFGGWGYRVALSGPLAGAKGFVLRSGTAIAVTRRTGAIDVVVVDDAATGAALLEAYRRRVTDPPIP